MVRTNRGMKNTTNAADMATIRTIRALRATLYTIDGSIAQSFTIATARDWRGPGLRAACEQLVRDLYDLAPAWWICEEQIAEAMVTANDLADAA